jgi:hypothetical protein
VAGRLQQLARGSARKREEELEQCELCAAPIGSSHWHLIDLQNGELMCACQACKILFDREAAGDGHYRLVPDRRLRLDGFVLDDSRWEALRIPVDMAFFFHSTRHERVVALYPSPAGPTESLLELEAWQQIERDNPALESMKHDVEALLVNRARGKRDYFLVPIEDPYRLVALIRGNWRGFSGGKEVWEKIDGFFAELSDKAKPKQEAA